MKPEPRKQDYWIKLSLARWLAVRAQGPFAIRAAVLLVLWLTALAFAYVMLCCAGSLSDPDPDIVVDSCSPILATSGW